MKIYMGTRARYGDMTVNPDHTPIKKNQQQLHYGKKKHFLSTNVAVKNHSGTILQYLNRWGTFL
jgi:hypothetical protein